MINIILAIGTLVCAVQAIRSERLIVSSIWLAGTSAFISVIMFLLGAPEVAVIELSVGAGLVTVLFVFAINIAGDEKIPRKTIIPKPLAALMIIISAALLLSMVLPNSIPIMASDNSHRFPANALGEPRSGYVITDRDHLQRRAGCHWLAGNPT